VLFLISPYFYRKPHSSVPIRRASTMNAPSGLSKECVTHASVQSVSAHLMKFHLSGKNSKNNQIQTWWATRSSVHKRIVLISRWGNGAHRKRTIARLCMLIWTRTVNHTLHMTVNKYGMQYTKRIALLITFQP
jgi:hypothetical protein